MVVLAAKVGEGPLGAAADVYAVAGTNAAAAVRGVAGNRSAPTGPSLRRAVHDVPAWPAPSVHHSSQL